MKRQAFIRELEQAGCEFVRHGKRHDETVIRRAEGKRRRRDTAK